MKWIEITESNPPPIEEVVLVFGDGCIRMGYLKDDNAYGRSRAKTRQNKWPEHWVWHEVGGCCYAKIDFDVTHWMALPEVPK